MKRCILDVILKSPSNEFRAHPFWCWNGKIEEEECYRQIDAIKDMGFGGFFIHSRTGLETEYMGDEWMSLVRKCIEYAKTKDLEAWLYDEDRWPSGTCGGEVTKNPEYRLRFISEYDSEKEANANENVVGILAKYAVKLNSKDELVDSYKVSSEKEVKEGYRYLVYAEEMMEKSDFYNGYTYLDTMNKEAVKKFFELTHEKYYEKCGDLFGTGLKGIFTDEPHRGATFIGFGITNKNYKRMISYTKSLPSTYEEKYGEQINYPEIYYIKENETFNEAAYKYIDTIDDLFVNTYAKYYQKWCSEHNIIATGHILHEDSVSIQTSLSGSMMRYYRTMDYPGVDHLVESNKAFWIVKQCSSVSHQLNKPFTLSELYGCTGWPMTFERYKYIGDWQALFGITFRCPHLSWYTMRGESKRDFPASIFYQDAWYKDWKLLEDYYARLSFLLSSGKQRVETLVIHPVESMWGLVKKGWMDGFIPGNEDISNLDEAFRKQFRELVASHIDFDYGDEGIISESGSIVERDGNVYFKVGSVEYSEVLVQNLTHIRKTTQNLLDEFKKKGGKVVSSINELSPKIQFKAQKEVAITVREFEDEVWAFMCNLDNENKLDEYHVVLPNEYKDLNVEEWDLVRNESLGQSDLNLSFEKGQMRTFRLGKKEVLKKDNKDYPIIELPKYMDYSLLEPNVLVLDSATFSINGEIQNNGEKKDILKIDRALRDKFNLTYRGGEMVQPWYAKKYNLNSNEKLADVKVKFEFESNIEKEFYIAIEKVDGIEVNGKKITQKTNLTFVDNCFDVYNGGILKKGKNTIIITYDFRSDTNLEAIYILGDFGVKLPNIIEELPDKLTKGDITTQGLPFYSGAILYKTHIDKGNYTVKFNKIGGTIVHIIGGKTDDFMCLSPYERKVELQKELQFKVVFTRRNTFGPFHIRPYPCPHYDPFSFVTEGDRWSDDFALEKQGLDIM